MLRIGALQVDFPVVQAALSGYSDPAMRRIARLHGAVLTFDEVVPDQVALRPGKRRRRVLNVAPDDHPLGGQLLGAEPGDLAGAADVMVRAGYDCLDINLACPVRKVLSRRHGGWLLGEPRIALEIVRAVLGAVAGRCPVTVKMRRGFDGSDRSERRFFEILDGAFEIGLDAAIVHPRTVKQRYVGPSQWGFLTRVKKHVGERVVVGSGDLFCAEDVARMLAQTGVDGVALARGCIGNPWIFRDCRAILTGEPLGPPPRVAEQGRIIARHLAWAIDIHGERRGCRIMRKFGVRYSQLHPYSTRVRDAILAARNRAQWQAVLDAWYDPDKDSPATERRAVAGGLTAAGAGTDEGPTR